MPTYIFIDKQEYEALKDSVKKLHEPPLVLEKPKPRRPLAFAFFALAAATALAAILPDAKLSVYAFVIGVVLAQCGIDLYRGESRPKWSAAFRLLALAAWYVLQTLAK